MLTPEVTKKVVFFSVHDVPKTSGKYNLNIDGEITRTDCDGKMTVFLSALVKNNGTKFSQKLRSKFMFSNKPGENKITTPIRFGGGDKLVINVGSVRLKETDPFRLFFSVKIRGKEDEVLFIDDFNLNF